MIINSDLKKKYYIKEKTSFKNGENTFLPSSPNYIPIYKKNDYSAKLIESLRFHLNNPNIKGYKLLQTFSMPYIKEGKIFQLNNGHKVIIIPKSGLTTIGTYVKTGFINEPLKGISHLLEHVIGNGDNLKNLSDKSYNSNASTSYQTTLYYQNVAIQDNNEINEYISGLSSALLKPDLSQHIIDREKEIILSESKMIKDNNNQPGVNILLENLFGLKNAKNFHIGVGSDENVKNITKQDLINYYNTYYTPDNMVSVIVGDVKYDDIMNSFSKNFKQESNTLNSTFRFPLQITPLQQTKRFDIINSSLNKPSVTLGFVGPKNNDLKGIIALDLIGQILLNKDNISILKKLKNYEQLHFSQCSINCNPKINNFINISSEVNNNPQKTLQSMYNLIFELSQKQITLEELQLIKEKIKNEMIKDNEGSLKIFQNIGLNYLSLNKIITSPETFKIIDSLTLQDIQNYTKQFLDLNKTCIVVEHPPKEKYISFKGKIPQINMENVKEYNLANNLKLVLDASDTNTSTVVNFSLNNKNVLPPKSGVDDILYVMLSIENKKHNASQLADIREKNLFNRTITSDKGSIDATIECPADKTVKAIDLITDYIYTPLFTRENFINAVNLLKSNAIQNEAMASPIPKTGISLIDKSLAQKSKTNHLLELMKTIDNITLKDVVDYYNSIINNAQGHCIITLPKDSLPQFQSNIFKILNEKVKPLKKFDPKTPASIKPFITENKVYIHKKNLLQTDIEQIFINAENESAKENVSVDIMALILKERLAASLRNSQKLAYNVTSESLYFKEKASLLSLKIQTDTKETPENLQKALNGFKSNINALIQQPVSKEELEIAKRKLVNKTFFNHEGVKNKNILMQRSLVTSYGINYENEKLKEIPNITIEDIQKTAKKFLTRPSVINIKTDDKTLEKNKSYLNSFGKMVEY